MTLYDTDEIIERVILVGVAFDTDDDTDRSLDELAELAKTAGAVTVGRMVQTRDNFHPATYIGKGKIRVFYRRERLFRKTIGVKAYG